MSAPTRHWRRHLWWLMVPLVAAPALAAPASELAKALSQLRADVEALSEELSLRRDRAREETIGWGQRKADLEAELQREQLRYKRLQQAKASDEKSAQAISEADAALRPAVHTAASNLKARIAHGLPFRQVERTAAVDELVQKLENNALSPSKVAARLWSVAQDELRLTKENGLYRQAIPLDDTEVLCDVARIGMVLMFFKAPDGRVGRAVRHDDKWAFEVLQDEQQRRQVLTLFDSFKKQVRVGYFELPAALPSTTKTEGGAQ